MISAPTQIINKLGLHARAAAKLVALAAGFRSEIALHCNSQEADAKSIMAVMMLAATDGTDLEVVCDGKDETEALAAVVELIEDRFGEEE